MRARNEALDCRIYARAAAWDVGMDRMQEKHWLALETQVGAAAPRKSAPDATERPGTQAPEPPAPPRPARDPWRVERRPGSWLGGRARHWLR